MKTILKIIITLIFTPIIILGLISATIIAIHETLWNSKKGQIDIE
jgi:hypothetical protein